MSKTKKSSLIALLAIICIVFMIAGCAQTNSNTINLTFTGVETTYTVKEGGESITVPDYSVDEDKTFLGWGTEADKTAESDVVFTAGSSISYTDVKDLSDSSGNLTLYPVISEKSSGSEPSAQTSTVAVTIAGDTTLEVTLTEGSTTAATEPEVTAGAKQEFIGWAITENATEVQIASGGITYTTASALATDGAVTLYPVFVTYDIVLGAVNVSYTLTDDEGNVKDIYDYIAEIKTAFTAAHSEISVLYRVYESSLDEGKVADCGAQINADGDVDVVLAGNNINSADAGNVTLIAKASVVSDWNPGSRYAGLITDSNSAIEMYAMLIGSENLNATITVKVDTSSDGVTTVVNKAIANEAELPTIEIPSGKILAGFSTTYNASSYEISTSSLTYDAVAAVLTEGAVTLYPVFGDLAVAIWAVNGTNTYAADEQIENMKTVVATYLTANNISAIIRYDIVSGTSSTYPDKIASDVIMVLGGPKVETQCGTTGLYTVLDVNVEFTNIRYISVYTDRVTSYGISSDLVTAFINALAEDTITVTIKSSETDTGVQTVLSCLNGNEADISGITVADGYSITGWVTTYGDTTAVITGSSVTYSKVSSLTKTGEITLYPIIEQIDLVVAIWAVNGSNIYATDEEIETLKTAFEAYLAENNTSANVRYDKVEGKTAEYASNIANDVIIILSGKNVVSQCSTTGCYQVINLDFSSIRYASVYTDRVTANNIDSNLVDLFIKFVADGNVTVTIKSSDTDTGKETVLNSISGNEADISGITVNDGYVLCGWTTTYGSTTVQISGSSLTYFDVIDLATNGSVTLYPVIAQVELVVAIWAVNGNNTYATDSEITAMEKAFTTYLAQLGITAGVRYDTVTGNTSAYPTNIASDAVIILSGSKVVSQCSTTGCYEVTNASFSSKRYASVFTDRVTTDNASLVSAFIKFATDQDVTYTPASTSSDSSGDGSVASADAAAIVQSAYPPYTVFYTYSYISDAALNGEKEIKNYNFTYTAADNLYSVLGC